MQGRLVNPEKKKTVQFFPSKNWPEEFKIAKKIKLNIMEWTINIENINQNPIFNGNLNIVKKLIKKYKIKVPSVTCDFFMQKPFFKKKIFEEEVFFILNKVIKNGSKIGIKYYILPLVDSSSIKTALQEEYLIKKIKIFLPSLKKKSKILFELDYKPKKIINFIKKFKSNKVGINFDTGNSASLNYNFDDEIKYFKYVKNVHIKDRLLYGKTVRLGQGNWDYKKFFKLLKRNYNGNFILQTARSANNNHTNELVINKTFFENEKK
jgi:hexulose-6-phosphate isomerase